MVSSSDESPQRGSLEVPDFAGTSSSARLRGADVPSVSQRWSKMLGAVVLVLLAAGVIVSYVTVVNDNARLSRLHSHGLVVNVRVQSCLGNLGGSGSNSASYTCRGSYVVGSTHYVEVINGLSHLVATGSPVVGVVDPANTHDVILRSVLRGEQSSRSRFLTPVLLTLGWATLVLATRRRRRGAGRRSKSPVPSS